MSYFHHHATLPKKERPKRIVQPSTKKCHNDPHSRINYGQTINGNDDSGLSWEYATETPPDFSIDPLRDVVVGL